MSASPAASPRTPCWPVARAAWPVATSRSWSGSPPRASCRAGWTNRRTRPEAAHYFRAPFMILPIRAYGDPILKKVAEDIQPGHAGLDQLVADMFETMYAANGVGL